MSWRDVRQTVTAPARILRMLLEIVTLLREQNLLLRSLHLKLTGRLPDVRPVSQRSTSTPANSATPRSGTRGQKETVVWQHTPQNEQEMLARQRRQRESNAGPNGIDDSVGATSSESMHGDDSPPRGVYPA